MGIFNTLMLVSSLKYNKFCCHNGIFSMYVLPMHYITVSNLVADFSIIMIVGYAAAETYYQPCSHNDCTHRALFLAVQSLRLEEGSRSMCVLYCRPCSFIKNCTSSLDSSSWGTKSINKMAIAKISSRILFNLTRDPPPIIP